MSTTFGAGSAYLDGTAETADIASHTVYRILSWKRTPRSILEAAILWLTLRV